MWNVPSEKRLAKIPTKSEDVNALEKVVYLHFFIGGCDWYVTEFDQEDTFFGFVILNNDLEMSEFGYFSFLELKEINMGGIEIDCELAKYFKPTKIKNIQRLKHLIPIYSK
jgi:hypothetical protein